MPEFLFNFTCTGTARLTADNLADTVRALTAVLDCLNPGITISEPGVTGAVTELSLSEGQSVLALAEVDGTAAAADLDNITKPVLCSRADTGDPECEHVYDETDDNSYMGMCLPCADTMLREKT